MPSKHFKFTGSKVYIGAGFVAASPAKVITGITKANPGVVTSATHGVVDGDVVRPSGIVGMTELNGGTYIAKMLTTSTFSLPGTDTTDLTTYVSGGTFSKIAYGANFCELTSYNRSGTDAPTIDTTSLCSTSQETDSGLPGFGTVELGYKFNPSGTVQASLEAARISQDIIAIKVVLPNSGGTRVLLGRVSNTSEQAGNGTIWTGTASIALTGAVVDIAAS